MYHNVISNAATESERACACVGEVCVRGVFSKEAQRMDKPTDGEIKSSENTTEREREESEARHSFLASV